MISIQNLEPILPESSAIEFLFMGNETKELTNEKPGKCMNLN